MPRQGRLHIVDALYHVMAHGIERARIFLDARDRLRFLDRLSETLNKNGCRCYAWALMPNHFHLLLSPRQKPLTDMMRSLLTGYAVVFNRRHKRTGHLFQNRYKSILCQKEAYFMELVRYIHLNPVRAGIVTGLDGLNHYPWVGHGALIGNRPEKWQEIKEVLRRFGDNKKQAIANYRQFVQEGLEMGRREEYSGGGLKRSMKGWERIEGSQALRGRWPSDERILGNDEFVTTVLGETEADQRRKTCKCKSDIEAWACGICRQFRLEPEEIRRHRRGNRFSTVRDLIAYWGIAGGFGRDAIASYLGVSVTAVNKAALRGMKVAKIVKGP